MAIRLEPQLDGSPTESVDCGVASTVMAVDYASDGKIRTTTERVRAKMAQKDGGTNPWDWQRAIRGFKEAAEKAGLKPLRSRIADGADLERLRVLLFEKRRPVIVALNYGVVADKTPRLWSSTSFRGAHAVLLKAGAERGGVLKVKVFDPLADGRTVGGKKMPNGPRWWDWEVVKQACASIEAPNGARLYPGGDRWLGTVIWKSRPLVPQEPPEKDDPPLDDDQPEPVEPEDAQDALVDAAGDIEEAIEILTGAKQTERVTTALAALASARNGIGPFLPPDSDSTSESAAGISPRPKD